MYIKTHKTRPRLVNGTLGYVVGFVDGRDANGSPGNGAPIVEFDGDVGRIEIVEDDFTIENRFGGGEPLAQRIQVVQ